ncbi:MAG TPA: prepilin-type N-terminal cleavage/methylation domain-containing protein [Armatimonadota bacterium]
MTRRAFTMIELMGVIAIIAVLAAILFPVFARARAKAQAWNCQSNLFNIGLALRLYASDHDGAYPPLEDDLAPLFPRYMAIKQPFLCPSDSASYPGKIPMGAPADYSLMGRSAPGEEAGGPPPPPGGPGGPPGPPPAPRPSIAPQYYPGAGLPVIRTQGPAAGPPLPPGVPKPMPLPAGTLFTSYYYRAGRQHNQLPRAPLISDQALRHNDGANVLFSDGAVQIVPEATWRAWGFVTLEEVQAAHRPPPPPPGVGGPPGAKQGGEGG